MADKTASGRCDLQQEAGSLRLSGHLDRDTVADLYRETLGVFRTASQPLQVDLAGIDYADSSGLALMLEWHSVAPDGSKPVFTRVPEHLSRLVHLSRAGKLLNLDQVQD